MASMTMASMTTVSDAAAAAAAVAHDTHEQRQSYTQKSSNSQLGPTRARVCASPIQFYPSGSDPIRSI